MLKKIKKTTIEDRKTIEEEDAVLITFEHQQRILCNKNQGENV